MKPKRKRPTLLAAAHGSADVAAKLKAAELSEDTLMEIEALGWRAMKAKEQEVADAVVVVICALQGYWKNPPNDRISDPAKRRMD